MSCTGVSPQRNDGGVVVRRNTAQSLITASLSNTSIENVFKCSVEICTAHAHGLQRIIAPALIFSTENQRESVCCTRVPETHGGVPERCDGFSCVPHESNRDVKFGSLSHTFVLFLKALYPHDRNSCIHTYIHTYIHNFIHQYHGMCDVCVMEQLMYIDHRYFLWLKH